MAELIEKLGLDWKLLLANMVTFLIVLWVLRKFAYGPIIRALETRQATIADSLQKAKDTDQAYRELQGAKEQLVKEAKLTAQDLLRQAESDAAKIRQAELEKTQAAAEQLIVKTRTQLDRERRDMVQAAKADVAALVVQATEQVLGQAVDAKLEKTLQEQALKEVKKL